MGFNSGFKGLSAFEELRRATISFVVSVRLSAWNNSAPIGRIFMKFNISVFFEKTSRKFKFHQNLTRIAGPVNEEQYTFIYNTSLSSSQKEKCVRKKVVEKINTHILCSITFPPPKFVPFWHNVEKKYMAGPARLQLTWHMRNACWIPKITNTHSEYVIRFAFPLENWLHECVSMLRYTHFVCLVCCWYCLRVSNGSPLDLIQTGMLVWTETFSEENKIIFFRTAVLAGRHSWDRRLSRRYDMQNWHIPEYTASHLQLTFR
jgi:hypothetical protein